MESLLPGSFKIPIKYNNKNFRTKETNRYFKYKEDECRNNNLILLKK